MVHKSVDHEDAFQKLGELIKDIQFAMMTTVSKDGRLRSRPMATQSGDFNGELWFFTHRWSAKTYELDRDARVNVSYAAPDQNSYVSISGTARAIVDKKKARQLWTPALKAWFPEGLETPDIALVRVTVEEAEYWDAPKSTMVKLVGFAKALLTGEEYNPGDHQKLRLTADDRPRRRTRRQLAPAHPPKMLEQNRAGRTRERRRAAARSAAKSRR